MLFFRTARVAMHFLQPDDIGTAFLNHLRDARRITPAIRADTFVNVIGEDGKNLHDRGSSVKFRRFYRRRCFPSGWALPTREPAANGKNAQQHDKYGAAENGKGHRTWIANHLFELTLKKSYSHNSRAHSQKRSKNKIVKRNMNGAARQFD